MIDFDKQALLNKTEEKYYSLDNPYLTREEKIDVEMWFQLPGDLMVLSFIFVVIYSVYNSISLLYLIGIPATINIIFGIINWYFYNKKLVKILCIIFNTFIVYVTGISATIFLLINGLYGLAIITLLAPFGVFSFLEIHIWIYTVLAKKYKLHCKYAFFKKYYGKTFPFEDANQ